MRISKVQIKIGGWAGACLLLTAVVILAGSAYTMRQAAMTARTEAVEAAKSQAGYIARQIAARIQGELDEAMSGIRFIGQTMAGARDDSVAVSLERREVEELLRVVKELLQKSF